MDKYLNKTVQPEAIGVWNGITIKQLGMRNSKTL